MANWYAVFTKPRSEKKVAERLEAQGYVVYVPLHQQKRKWSDRYKLVKVPILPSYVFVKVEELERENVLQDPGVVCFVFWLGKPAVIREAEIKRMKVMLDEAKPEDEFFVEKLELNEKVEVAHGAFSGESGIVVNAEGVNVTIVLDGLGVKLTLKRGHLKI